MCVKGQHHISPKSKTQLGQKVQRKSIDLDLLPLFNMCVLVTYFCLDKFFEAATFVFGVGISTISSFNFSIFKNADLVRTEETLAFDCFIVGEL